MIVIIFSTAVIILQLLPLSRQVVIQVTTCPSTQQSWEQRSSNFLCPNQYEIYHCIQANDESLIETCMIPQIINCYKVGCPWVKVINGKVYLGNPFNPCNAEHGHCPEESHSEYQTNQLYIYTACIKTRGMANCTETNRSTFPKGNSTPPPLKEQNGPEMAIVIVCLSLLSTALLIYVFIHCRRREGKRTLA